MKHRYWVYILTNKNKTTLYVGVTRGLEIRVEQHTNNAGKLKTFAGRYNCHHLVYFEEFKYIDKAIKREKQLKAWPRADKVALIEGVNPDWVFLDPPW